MNRLFQKKKQQTQLSRIDLRPEDYYKTYYMPQTAEKIEHEKQEKKKNIQNSNGAL